MEELKYLLFGNDSLDKIRKNLDAVRKQERERRLKEIADAAYKEAAEKHKKQFEQLKESWKGDALDKLMKSKPFKPFPSGGPHSGFKK